MPRGSNESFLDFLTAFMGDIGRAKMAPDADLEFLGEVESMILERIQNPNLPPRGIQAGGAQPNFSAQQAGMEPPTRLPQRSPDMSGAIAELAGAPAGAPQ